MGKRRRRPIGLPHTIGNDATPVRGRLKSPCWIWKWACSGNGYGSIWTGGKQQLAHRWYYEQMVGPIRNGMQIDHLCYETSCIAPLHLEQVPAHINAQRQRSTKLNPGMVIELRKMSAAGKSNRDIAAIMGICHQNVSLVVNSKRWKNVNEKG